MQWFRRKDKQVRTMHRHSCRITTLLCFKTKSWYLLCLLRRSRAKYGQSSSGSSVLEQNLERELWFGVKPRAGAPFWSKTSSRSSCLEPNLERERIRALSRAKYAMHGVVEGSGEQKHGIYCVFARLKAQSSKVGLFSDSVFHLKLLAQPTF